MIDIHNELHNLIKQAASDDRLAQKALYQRYSPRLLSICRQYIRDIHQAEDVMVTAFMKILTHLSKFEAKGSFEAWIRRITVNACISHIRANKNVPFTEEDIHFEESCQTDSDLMAQDIQIMIDRLPYGCKMVFNLYVVEGYKHHEIADLLAITEGTSKSQLAYARKLLQQCITQQQNTHYA